MEILPKESDPVYLDKLTALLKSAKEWENIEGFAYEIAVENFMIELGQLYLEYFQFHPEDAKICAIDFQPLLPLLVEPINENYISPIMRGINHADSWDDPWERACWLRTNIEAFHTLFGDIAGRLDDEDIIEYMEGMKGSAVISYDKIPKVVTKNHWWWFTKYVFKE